MQAKKEYFGCKFYELSKCGSHVNSVTLSFPELEIEGHIFRDVRISMPNCNLSVDLTEGARLYPQEVQIHGWSFGRVKAETRAFNNNHNRLEIPMSVDQGLGFFYDALRNYEDVPKQSSNARSIKNLAELLL